MPPTPPLSGGTPRLKETQCLFVVFQSLFSGFCKSFAFNCIFFVLVVCLCEGFMTFFACFVSLCESFVFLWFDLCLFCICFVFSLQLFWSFCSCFVCLCNSVVSLMIVLYFQVFCASVAVVCDIVVVCGSFVSYFTLCVFLLSTCHGFQHHFASRSHCRTLQVKYRPPCCSTGENRDHMIKGISPVAVTEKPQNLYFSLLLPLYLDQTSDHLASNLPLQLLMIALYTCLVAHTLTVIIPIFVHPESVLLFFSSVNFDANRISFTCSLPQCLCQIHPRNAHRWRVADYSNPS